MAHSLLFYLAFVRLGGVANEEMLFGDLCTTVAAAREVGGVGGVFFLLANRRRKRWLEKKRVMKWKRQSVHL